MAVEKADKVVIEVVISDVEIDLDNYKSTGAKNIAQAIMVDLGLYESGEVAIEDLVYNYGGSSDVELRLGSVSSNKQHYENGFAAGEVIDYDEGE